MPCLKKVLPKGNSYLFGQYISKDLLFTTSRPTHNSY